jgi:3-oxoacyl-[acyl-carrier-protein] synthase II
MPYLKVKKLRKYMGVQDDLAVVAAAKALESAGLRARSVSEGLGERTGLYLAVGYIPFEQADLDPLLAASLDADGNFSMEAFSTAGFRAVNGLLTFRCLPNMPAYHVSANFDIQGPYYVTYPGPGQFYVVLDEALMAMDAGSIDVALVGGVAHQRNFLVESHFARVRPPIPAERLVDAAGCLVLERKSHAAARGAVVRGKLSRFRVQYAAHYPFAHELLSAEGFDWAPRFAFPGEGERRLLSLEMGPASLAVFLSHAAGRLPDLAHWLRSRDGVSGKSDWSLS